MDDEFQHYISDDEFWFMMRCDICGKLVKVFAKINYDKCEEIEEK
ncbi:MAG: hypothetical protein WC934_06355 [Acidithiobacillus sp.]|jgi:hypothetical protein